MEPKDDNLDDLVIDYALGEIDPADRARVELLLAERPELMREARALKRMVSRLGISMISPPPRLVSRARHAAHEAGAKRGTRAWLVRRPVLASVAGLVALALLVVLVGPSIWSLGPGKPPKAVGEAGTVAMPHELNAFLLKSLEDVRALTQGRVHEDLSERAAEAMLWQKQPLPEAQRAVLQDIEALWREGYKRINLAGRLTDDIIMRLKGLAAEKRLVERIEALLGP
jgi:anti-sigma factor RsiW